MLNGIYWRLRTGSPRADISERYGPATTCSNRFRRWAKIGVGRIFEAVSKAYNSNLQMIDSSDEEQTTALPPAGRPAQTISIVSGPK